MLQPLRDSSALLRAANFASLAETLHRDGYLFLPGSLQKAQVSAARLKVIDHLDRHGGVLDPSADSREGVLREGCGQGCVPFLEGRNEVTHCPEVIRVFEGEAMRSIFAGLFGASGECKTAANTTTTTTATRPADEDAKSKRASPPLAKKAKRDPTSSSSSSSSSSSGDPALPPRSFDFKWLRAVSRQPLTCSLTTPTILFLTPHHPKSWKPNNPQSMVSPAGFRFRFGRFPKVHSPAPTSTTCTCQEGPLACSPAGCLLATTLSRWAAWPCVKGATAFPGLRG